MGHVRALDVNGFAQRPARKCRIVTNESGDECEGTEEGMVFDFDIESLGRCDYVDVAFTFFFAGTNDFDNEHGSGTTFEKILRARG